ncbi:MAG: asparaginase domain-containing protein [Campylobacterales bacterium]
MIAIVTTGGTIGMEKGLPSMGGFEGLGAEVIGFANEPSPFFDSGFAARLAAFLQTLLGRFDGVVVTHGTDTLEETAFYLDLVLSPDFPVVLTGAIHMKDEPAYDGIGNLKTAIIAAQTLGGGVYAAFDHDVFAGRYVVKTSPVSRRAFSSIKTGRLGAVVNGKLIRYFDLPARKTRLENRPGRGVALIKAHYDLQAGLIEPMMQKAKAVVFEGFGGGRIPRAAVDLVVKTAREKPLVLCGGVSEGYSGDGYAYEGSGGWFEAQKIPVIFSLADAKKSAIALGLCLGNNLDAAAIGRFFADEVY